MKKLASTLGLGLMLSSACMAQFKIDGDDGTTVTIGPGGINVNAPHGGTNLNIGPGGVTGVAGGKRQINVTPGGISTGRVYSTSTQKSTSTSHQKVDQHAQSGDALNLMERVNQLEMGVSGRTNPGMSLIARVEKLETDNLGKKGSGTLKDRVDALAKALGITFKDPNVRTFAPVPSSTGLMQSSASQVTFAPSGASAVVTQDIMVSSSNQHLDYKMNGGSVTLAASNCHVRLNGPCDKLIIDGSENHITADNVNLIVVNGASNHVTWQKDSTPKVVDNGTGNHLSVR